CLASRACFDATAAAGARRPGGEHREATASERRRAARPATTNNTTSGRPEERNERGAEHVSTGPVVTLVLTSLAIMGSPGPVTVSLTAAGATFGARRSVGYLVGVVLGTSVVLAAVATGLTALLLSVPAVRPALLGASGGYLLWLAYRIATAHPGPEGSPPARPPSLAGGALLGVA